MQTLIRVLLLGAFALAGGTLAVFVAVRTEGPPGTSPKPEQIAPVAEPLADSESGHGLAVLTTPKLENPAASRTASLPAPHIPVAEGVDRTPASSATEKRDPSLAGDEKQQADVLQRSVDRAIAERAEAVAQQVDLVRALMRLVREETGDPEQSGGGPPATASETDPESGPLVAPLTRQPSAGSQLPTPRNPPSVRSGSIEEIPTAPLARIEGEGDGGLVINIQEADIRDVLEMFSQQGKLNILPSPSVQGLVSASLQGVDLMTALQGVIRMAGYQMRQEGRFIYVGTSQDMQLLDLSNERLVTRVYRPNYVSAAELQTLVTPLLTAGLGDAALAGPTSASVATQSVTSTPPARGIAAGSNDAGADDFAGSDVLIVRDFRSVLQEIDQLVAEVDCRPRQVVIEAMILSVRLDDSHQLGVDFELLRGRENARLVSGSPLNDVASLDLTSGGLKFGLLGSDVGAFVDALETVGDTNVIASPRLMCLNKQRAEILIGSQLGYVSTTVTENAATQAVEFLEVGTQLRLRPYISDDGMIRMEVHPELSTGSVRIEGGFTLPDKEVTQVTTNVMCHNGSTIIIGGLIREDLGSNASHIPLLGTLPGVGRLFQRSSETIDRREIIVLLTPRIVSGPHAAKQGKQVYLESLNRQEIFTDKMSPVGKRYYGKRYLRQARAAWNAGDASAALRYANLSIHFDPMNLQAINLRESIVASTPFGDASIDRRLRDGLPPWQHPRTDYSRLGVPWRPPTPFPTPPPVQVYDPGRPDPVRELRSPDQHDFSGGLGVYESDTENNWAPVVTPSNTADGPSRSLPPPGGRESEAERAN